MHTSHSGRSVARLIVTAAGSALIASSLAFGQAQSPDLRIAFEVASVKPEANTRGRGVAFVPLSGSVLFTHHSVLDLINYAFGLKSGYELAGAPDWARKEQFDVRGNPPQGISNEAAPRMMQTLLAERFGLRAHHETRDLNVYELALARPGVRGPSLRQSTHDCAAFFATGATLGSRDVPLDENGHVACGTTISIASLSEQRLSMLGVTMTEVAHGIERFGGLGRPITDGTGLTGTWNVIVQFSPPPSAATQLRTESPLFETALLEQLGLRLVPKRAARPVLVVDSVARPTPD